MVALSFHEILLISVLKQCWDYYLWGWDIKDCRKPGTKKVHLNIARKAEYAEKLSLIPSCFCTVQSYNQHPQQVSDPVAISQDFPKSQWYRLVQWQLFPPVKVSPAVFLPDALNIALNYYLGEGEPGEKMGINSSLTLHCVKCKPFQSCQHQ